MRRAIGFVNTTAYGAGSRRIPWVYQDYGNTCAFRLVLDKVAELEERPTMQCGALAATNRNPRTDTLQVFQGYRTLRVFRLRHNLLADAVVDVLRKKSFFTRELFELALGRAHVFGLQFGAQAAVPVTYVIDVAGRVDFSIAVYSNIGYSQVNPQCAFHVNGFRFFDFAGSGEEEHSPIEPQVAFPLSGLEQFALTLAADERGANPHIDCLNRDAAILQPPRQNAVIVGDDPRSFEGSPGFAVEFVGVCDFGDCSYRNLGRQIKPISNIFVASVVQVMLPKDFRFPSIITDELASGIGLLNGSFECVSLFGSGEQFDLGDEFHASNYRTNELFVQGLNLALLVLNITLDGFGAHVSSRSAILTFGPKDCFLTPIMAAQNSKFLYQPSGTDAVEQAHDFGGRIFRRCAHEQMYVVGHYLNGHDLKTILRCNLRKENLQTFSNFACQRFLSVSRYSNKMVLDYVHSMGRLSGGFVHTLILSLQGAVVEEAAQCL